MAEALDFSLTLEQQDGFEFRVRFDWPDVPDLLLDEPEPLGAKRGPNAARLVAAAVANCLSASLVFCLRTKFKQNPKPITSRVTGHLVRNERGRYRIGGFEVTITLGDEAGDIGHLERCREQFEDFCVVTESIRHGIPVAVRVVDAAGRLVHESSGTEALSV
jgi:organic hydroperoxide reductase OsmC/OhrA